METLETNTPENKKIITSADVLKVARKVGKNALNDITVFQVPGHAEAVPVHHVENTDGRFNNGTEPLENGRYNNGTVTLDNGRYGNGVEAIDEPNE